MTIRSAILCACAGLGLASAMVQPAMAQPVNTTLPMGWSWQSIPGGVYDTGLVGTKRGGFNGQQVGPFNDTSFGIMDEQNTPWFDGSDLSAQQYVQDQEFGNFGTGSPPGPAGTRFFNFGFNGTNFGANFSNTTQESRTVSINNWNNANPDAGGVASFGQVVYVPVSATLTVGQGFGADEMVLKAIGGINANTSRFLINSQVTGSWNTAGFGGIANLNNSITLGSLVTFNDPGAAFGNYDMPYGFGAALGGGQIALSNTGTVRDEGVNVGVAGQGIPVNSMGVGLTDSYNVLSSLLQDGSSASFTFDATALVQIDRIFGNADARASMGPGMEGNVRLVVEWQAFRAIPSPSAVALLGLGGLVAARRRRA